VIRASLARRIHSIDSKIVMKKVSRCIMISRKLVLVNVSIKIEGIVNKKELIKRSITPPLFQIGEKRMDENVIELFLQFHIHQPT
jgi:hypothetical protein